MNELVRGESREELPVEAVKAFEEALSEVAQQIGEMPVEGIVPPVGYEVTKVIRRKRGTTVYYRPVPAGE